MIIYLHKFLIEILQGKKESSNEGMKGFRFFSTADLHKGVCVFYLLNASAYPMNTPILLILG